MDSQENEEEATVKGIVLAARFLQRFFPSLVDSKMKLALIKSAGVSVGEGTVLFDAGRVNIDCSRPSLLSIGSYCKITSGVVVLAHDYSRSVLRRVYGDVVAEARKTQIGDNVFIGMNSIILMGTHIGNNCIVGAGSVCHGNYPDNSVVAGNPAKVICSLDDYYAKRKQKYVHEAMDYVILYRDKYGKYPTISEMGAFFPLFLPRSKEALEANNIRTALSGDSQEDVIDCFLRSTPQFEDYGTFLDEVEVYEKECDRNNVRLP